LEEKVLVFVELAAGIVIGFILFSYIAPSLGAMNITPSA
jgi:hypothetical protein